MRLSLEIRRALKGDCLLLHFGDKDHPGLMLIDGGPATIYGTQLKYRLGQLRKERELPDGQPLIVDVLMVSHVDDDHIRGVVDLTRDELQRQNAGQPKWLNVLDLWHNSFDKVISHNTKPLTAAMSGHFGEAATSGGSLAEGDLAEIEQHAGVSGDVEIERVQSTMQVLASLAQGHRLRTDADGLNILINDAFDGDLIAARPDAPQITVGDDLTITIVGPLLEDLDALRKKHMKWLQTHPKLSNNAAALAAYVDDSVPNLSSIVTLVEAGGKRILLTGDARGDKILEGLELVGLLKPGGKIEVDILKVPHHGSSNNLEQDFFERIIASHYVFSGDGQHGNPERESMEMLFAARGNAPFTIHLTYPVAEIDKKRVEEWEIQQKKEKARGQDVRPEWSPEKQSLTALFKEKNLAKGQTIEIVDDKSPKPIHLLDPIK